MPKRNEGLDPKIEAGVNMLRRAGAQIIDFRYQDDQPPTVWMTVATWPDGKWEVAAGHNIVISTMRLLAAVLNGGICVHCKRVTAFEADFEKGTPAESVVCWYVYDPELKTIRRGCE